MKLKYFLLITLFIIFKNVILLPQEAKKIEVEKFGHEIYQVKPHPNAEFITLENGFRYILLPNKTPEKRVMVYLYVNSGSLNETDQQQGLAHF